MPTDTTQFGFAIQEIRRSLHNDGAAVMIGAGFSRNADSTGSSCAVFPDWSELTSQFIEKLYPDATDQKRVRQGVDTTSAALRLAQEFQTAFHRPALRELVQSVIREDEYTPSVVHDRLVDLPWVDIFTTNFDQLIERAARNCLNYRWDVVQSPTDLPLAKGRRIIKLHGSLPELEHLVLTEDDFRLYPKKYAPFVATVQASLARNVLCLVGFSGDDPNFLAWSGWVRDELKESAPNIYLLTIDELPPFQRQLLESRQITPIEICKESSESDPRAAILWFIDQLRVHPSLPTAKWNTHHRFPSFEQPESFVCQEPRCPSSPTASDWLSAALEWRARRLEFQGWHVLSRAAIEYLWSRTEDWLRLADRLPEALNAAERIVVLHELSWRCARSLFPLLDDVVVNTIDPALAAWDEFKDSNEACSIAFSSIEFKVHEIERMSLDLRLELLRHAREVGDENRFFEVRETIKQAIKRLGLSAANDELQFAEYQTVLANLSRLDLDQSRAQLLAWDTRSADPIWGIRKAGLMLECGLQAEARKLQSQLSNAIRRLPLTKETDFRSLSAEGLILFQIQYIQTMDSLGFDSDSTAPKESVPNQCDDSDSFTSVDRADDTTKKKTIADFETPTAILGEDNPPERQAVIARLQQLELICSNPESVYEWLSLANEISAEPACALREKESFDLGYISRTAVFSDQGQTIAAYRAVRFIEDSGIPLTIHGCPGFQVGKSLYANAISTLFVRVPHEALGFLLRMRSASDIEANLDRATVAKLTSGQLESLRKIGVEALSKAVESLSGPFRPPRSERDEQWESQFEAALAILGHIVVRLEDEGVEEILIKCAGLQSELRLQNRHWLQNSLDKAGVRACKVANSPMLKHVLPALLELPVEGSDVFPQGISKRRPGQDAIDSLKQVPYGSIPRRNAYLDDSVRALIEGVRSKNDKQRVGSIHRLAQLLYAGLLKRDEQHKFAAALYSRTAEGLPAGTGYLDSLVLDLPRPPDIPEASLFRKKYVVRESGTLDEYWRELSRTVTRFKPTTGRRVRTVPWTRSDLEMILDRAEHWIEDAIGRFRKHREMVANQHPFAHFPGAPGNVLGAYRNWLYCLEDVVLLNRSVAERQAERCLELLNRASKESLPVLLLDPTLVVLELKSARDAEESISTMLLNPKLDFGWQARSAILRWCEHTERGKTPTIPRSLLMAFSVLISSLPRPDLPQLLGAVREVLRLLPSSIDPTLPTRIDQALGVVLSAMSSDERVRGISANMALQIRIACTRLAAEMRQLGFKSPATDRWLESAKHDTFREVRNAAFLHID